MITDKKRREVVERLRAPMESMLADSTGELIRLRHVTGCRRGQDIYERLADLIDRPTCRIVYSAQLHSAFGDPIAELKIYGLSCEHQAIGSEKPRYCPKCGAAIVDD